MNEFVQISLSRYNDLVNNSRKTEVLWNETFKDIGNLLQNINIEEIDNTPYKEIYRIYERMCKEI